jgi:hypothetical protein
MAGPSGRASRLVAHRHPVIPNGIRALSGDIGSYWAMGALRARASAASFTRSQESLDQHCAVFGGLARKSHTCASILTFNLGSLLKWTKYGVGIGSAQSIKHVSISYRLANVLCWMLSRG